MAKYTTKEALDYIYRKTNGYCYHCGKKIARKNYGKTRVRGAWEVEHGNPKSRGGVDDRRNWFPSCVSCNRKKGTMTTTEFRRQMEKARNSDKSGGRRLTLAEVNKILWG